MKPRCRAKRGCRGRRPLRALRGRYGCFRLPDFRNVPEAKVVKKAPKSATWLARTDPKAKQVEFSEAYDHLSEEGQRFITLHERAHLQTGPDHNADFYEALKKLIKANRVSWEVAFELESFNCHHAH